jgi:hypothetical protein
MAGTLTASGFTAGLLTGQKTIGPIAMTGTAVIGQITDATLATGDNTLTVPSGAYAVLIALPANSTPTLKVRTNVNAADGGLPIGSAGYCVFPIAAGVTSLIVNASATVSIEASYI